jgi:hypothetical protein
MAPRNRPSSRPEASKEVEKPKSQSDAIMDVFSDLKGRIDRLDLSDEKALHRLGKEMVKALPHEWLKAQEEYYSRLVGVISRKYPDLDWEDYPGSREWFDDEKFGIALGSAGVDVGDYMIDLKRCLNYMHLYFSTKKRESRLLRLGVKPVEKRPDSINFDRVFFYKYFWEMADIYSQDSKAVKAFGDKMLKDFSPEWVANRLRHFTNLLKKAGGEYTDKALPGGFDEDVNRKIRFVIKDRGIDADKYIDDLVRTLNTVHSYRLAVGSRGKTEREMLSDDI